MNCIHKQVCKHYMESKVEAPPAAPEVKVDVSPKKKHAGRKPKDYSGLEESSDKDIKTAMKALQQRKYRGKLTDAQVSAFDSADAKEVSDLSSPERIQMLDILCGVK